MLINSFKSISYYTPIRAVPQAGHGDFIRGYEAISIPDRYFSTGSAGIFQWGRQSIPDQYPERQKKAQVQGLLKSVLRS